MICLIVGQAPGLLCYLEMAFQDSAFKGIKWGFIGYPMVECNVLDSLTSIFNESETYAIRRENTIGERPERG